MTTHAEYESIAALDAVGAATADEAASLRAHAETCEPCARAQAELADAATLLVRDLEPVEPPRELRARVLGAVGDDVATLEHDDDRTFFNRWWWSAAAMLFLALWGWRELGIRALRERAVTAEAEATSLRDENARLNERNDKLATQMAAVASPATKTIALTGQQVAPTASARVYLEPEHRRAIVFFYNMPANANDRSYQLWILRADQPKPQSAGTFDVTPTGTASLTIDELPVATEIKGLAVTLEPRGGAEQPTSAQYFVAGTI